MEQLMNYLDLGAIITFIWEHKFWLAAAIPIIIVISVVRGRS